MLFLFWVQRQKLSLLLLYIKYSSFDPSLKHSATLTVLTNTLSAGSFPCLAQKKNLYSIYDLTVNIKKLKIFYLTSVCQYSAETKTTNMLYSCNKLLNKSSVFFFCCKHTLKLILRSCLTWAQLPGNITQLSITGLGFHSKTQYICIRIYNMPCATSIFFFFYQRSTWIRLE